MSISDYDLRPGSDDRTGSGAPGARVDLRRRLSESRPVTAPHYTELVDHGATELARIVAARHGWRLTGRDVLVDEQGERIAPAIERAGSAMLEMGWFAGDEDGELWIDWMMAPASSAAMADAVRTWMAAHDPGVRSRTIF